MKNALAITAHVINLVRELNALSIKRTALDPLIDINYKVYMQYPENEGISVRITISRTAGAELETANMINNSISFSVKKKKIEDICFYSDARNKQIGDIKLMEDTIDAFIEQIRDFCVRQLPGETKK